MSTNAPSIEEQETPLDADEPHTPTWFTFLGVGLFLLGGIFLLATSDDEVEAPVIPTSEAGEAVPAQEDKGDPPPAAEAADPHAGHGHD